MKKLLSLSILFTLIIALTGCQTKEEDHAGTRGEGVIPLISDLTPGIFIANDGNSYVQFVVAFSEGESSEQTDVVISHGSDMQRVKFEDLNTFPATVSIKLSQVASLLGETISDFAKGDVVYIEVETVKNGVLTRSTVGAVAISVVCAFNPALTQGSYHSLSPKGQWQSEGNITLTADVNDPYTIYVTGIEAIEDQTESGPLVMHINPTTFGVVADKSVIVAFAFDEYNNLYYQGTGTYNSCTGKYTMNFTIGADGATFGTYAFTFTKNLN